MGFQRVRFYQFRNIADGEVVLEAPKVFLVGANGQGKSNFLEALYVLSYGGSFRTRRDRELCRNDTDEMGLDGTIIGREGPTELAVRYREGRKTIRLDGGVVQDRRDIISLIPSVLFRHDDMAFVTGSPDMQRWFLDQTASMNDPSFIDDLRRYRRVLSHRNQVIRDRRGEMLPVYDRQLADEGLRIQKKREEVLHLFNVVFTEEFRRISGLSEELSLHYRPSWERDASAEAVTEHLIQRREQEFSLRTTTSGPHRDRVLFRYGGRDFLTIASTGQIRLVSLILRIAQARFHTVQTGRLPVLLLDDVLLELDQDRRTRFLERLPEAHQIIFTFLPGEPYEDYRTESTIVYTVSDGVFRRA